MTMVKFTIYRPDTGEILKAGDCLETDLALQAGDGEAIWPDENLDDTAWRIVDGEKVAVIIDLAALERDLLAAIDRAAEIIHGRILGKSLSLLDTHMAKKAEALAIQADPTIAADKTPRLALEAASSGLSREACALIVLARAADDERISALIDDIRRVGKSAVRAAETEPSKRAAAEAVDWTPVTSGEAK